MENKKGISKKVWLIIISIIFVVGIVLGLSTYMFYAQPKDVEIDELNGGEVLLTYTDDENVFTINNAVKMSDADGIIQNAADKYFDFTVSTDINNANNIEYSIILVKDDKASTALNDNIKIYLEKQNSGSYVEAFGPGVFAPNLNNAIYNGDAMTILKVSKKNSSKDNYRLRMWVSDDANITPEQIQNYSVKIIVEGKAS